MSAGRDVLLHHKRELENVIARNAFLCTTNEAKRWLRHVNSLLAQPHRHEDALSFFGPNWHGPALDTLYRTAAFHADAWVRPVEEAFEIGRAA